MTRGHTRTSVVLTALALAGCSPLPPMVSSTPPARTSPAVSAPVAAGAGVTPNDQSSVRTTLLPGRAPVMSSVTPAPVRGGPVALNFPNVDVQAVARAVLGDLLHLPYTVPPEIHTPITLRTGRRIARADVLPAFEAALHDGGLALVAQPGDTYAILPLDRARAAAGVAGEGAVGFASETVRLSFVNADELRRLIDPVLPGVVTGADAATNTLTISGSEGQRRAARDLVRQFDVDWLRGTSFGLYVPRQTDSRLIVPELNKVLNADGAPTRNMVRLIAMDRLNGILAVSTQPQYLEDVRRWVEILDREAESNSRRLFVYHVQNGRAGDLARTLASAFGQSSPAGRPPVGFQDTQRPPGVIGPLPGDSASAAGAVASSGLGPPPAGSGPPASPAPGTAGGAPDTGAALNVETDEFHVKITSDEVNNAIVTYATPRDYAVIEDALRKLDVAPYQVMIEAAIAEVTLTDALRFGVQGLYNHGGTSVGLTESLTSAVPIQDFPGFSALYAAKSVSAALNTLEGYTKVKVVSAPKLMVLNNQTASIEVGAQVPILTGSATSVISSNAPVVNSVDYRDTGIILKVTPRVNSSGFVLMDLAQEVSAVLQPTSSTAIQSPTISTRRIATSVAVQDGEVIALGGMISDNRNDVSSGLPGLSRIPILGPLLFGNINNNDTRTELIVLLRPEVVRNVDDGRAVTEELRTKLKSLSGLLPPGGVAVTPAAKSARDRGSATLGAVLSAACFAMLAAQMARTSRSAIVGVNASLSHARLAADADAGLAMALAGLTAETASAQWDLGRGVRTFDFDGAALHIVVEDERGKIALNSITPAQVRVMFDKGGAAAASVDGLVNAFLDFRDPDRVGAQATAPSGRQGGFRTVEELGQVPGVTPDLYAALAPSATATPGVGGFDPRTATPLALAVMQGDQTGPQAIERQREMDGERTALSAEAHPQVLNRTLTVRVDATGADGGTVEKATLIELTGHPQHPYIVRQQIAGFG